MNISELEPLIIEWAIAKNLIHKTQEQALAQLGKTREEVGELQEAIAQLDKQQIRLEAGDVLVTLVIQCAIEGEAYLWDSILYAEEEADMLLESDSSSFFRSLASISMEAANDYIEEAIKTSSEYGFVLGFLAMAVERAIAPHNLALDECLEAAWLKIRSRTGKTVDGVFVRDRA